MKEFKFNRVWQVLYPVLVYFILYQVARMVFRKLLPEGFSDLFCLMLSAIITIIPLYLIYVKLPIDKASPMFQKEDYKASTLILGTVLTGILINVFAAKFPIINTSEGFAEANKVLFSDGKLVMILANVIIIPFLEELLYRAIVLGQLSMWINEILAVIISALFFGLFHFNIVQFVYAFIMGILLGLIYVKYKKLWMPYLAHALVNLFVVLQS
ncbi:MAG: CPBP family intramembrane metalloprotease [Lachnospiraceae bacterium]|nr:CPBP family intramembrane metalloprotease [Lachnospiraceae bacterium]